MRIYILIFFLSSRLWDLGDIHLNILNNQNEIIPLEEPVVDKFLSAELIDGKLYLKIPKTLLETPMLFVNHHDGYRHLCKQVIWTKFENQLILEAPRVKSETGVILPINQNPSILKNTIAICPIIKLKSKGDLFYIEATNLVLGNSIDWEANAKETVVADLSYIIETKHSENEVIIKTNRVTLENQIKITTTADFSFFLLPEPMKPRRYDYRMGFFCEDKKSTINRGLSSPLASITRWRLEKKHKHRDTSVPVKPITFLLSDDIPVKWQPYVKAGILEWLPAFEAAGFMNALEVIEGNAREGVPMNSVNHSIVRWGYKKQVRGYEDNSGSTISNVVDLRSGEILKADIIIGSSLQHLSDAYFIRCAPIDQRAQQYPFPDNLMGELIQRVVAHEAGHTFGIMDANYGEFAYPFEKMRDERWLRTMGYTPSIMTYARHNYIVQPEDNIDPSLLIQKVGPNDSYNIRWAYTPFNNDEEAHLERMIRWQDSIPWYRFVNSGYENLGPSTTDEVVDNNDPINSTIMGLKNMKRVIELLPKVNQDKKDFTLIKRLHTKTLKLWRNQMLHVLSLIGGYHIHYKAGNQPGDMYTPVAYDIQMEAMDFFIEQAFNPPEWLVYPKYLNKINYTTYPDEVSELELRLLLDLIAPKRMKRLEYMERDVHYQGITIMLLSKLRDGLFNNLDANRVFIDSRIQELQILYITQLCKYVSQEKKHLLANKNLTTYTNHSKSLFLLELLTLKSLIIHSLKKDMDKVTEGHLKLTLQQMKHL
jgi:hypothetical protein